jgi:hypothetical protein
MPGSEAKADAAISIPVLSLAARALSPGLRRKADGVREGAGADWPAVVLHPTTVT